jgi:hypothetical protein
MLTTQDFIQLYAIEQGIIERQTAGLTQADTLIQPQPSGNCMNWVLGHLLETQLGVLALLGQAAPIDLAEVAIYRRESEPIRGNQAGVLSLERLLEHHRTVTTLIGARLAEMSDADFATVITRGERTMTVGYRLFFLHFHYSYHVGQLELLRQLAGKIDKVI